MSHRRGKMPRMNLSRFLRRSLGVTFVVTVLVAASVTFTRPAAAQLQGTRTDTVCTYNGAISNTNPMGCRRQVRIVDKFPGTPATYFGTWESADGAVFRVECFQPSSWETWCVLLEFLFANVAVPVVPNPTPSVPLATVTASAQVVPVSPPQIAFTGAESGVLGYVGAGLVAFGAVVLGSRRKFFAGSLD